MKLARLHRRLAVLMGLAGLLAFAAGAGFEPISAFIAGVALITALFWHPSRSLSARLEPVWLPVAALLVARALWHVFFVGDDVVIPVVDLLLLLLCAESLRSLDAPNDARLYALSFALLLAATAYRPGVIFAIAFVAYVALATVTLTLGHLRRKAERHGVVDAPVDRTLVGATAGLGAVVLAMSAAVFVAFPRVSRGWAGRGELPVVSVAGFSETVSIGEFGSQIYANPQIVLRVEFPDGQPADVAQMYWRGRTYDRFDGVRWSRSYPMPPSSAPSSWYRERWQLPMFRQRIYAAPLESKVLFAVHPVLRIDADRRMQALFDNAGDYVYWGAAAPDYTAWSMSAPPSADELRGAEGGFLPGRNRYLQLPALSDAVRALADSLTAGAESRYDRVMAVQSHLRRFTYTLELPRTPAEARLEHFLFQRRAGHCEYFSTAMVVMLRTLGIQAREVNGFRGGEWSQFGDYLAVTQNQAHSWVEVWFPNYGWVTFDPTPGGAGSTTEAAAWYWPGRFLFDALQHRWNKWVLDYNVDTQGSLFDRLRRWSEEGIVRPVTPGQESDRIWWALGALVLALAGAAWGLARRGAAHPYETRAYLRLVETCRRGGVVGAEPLGPLELVEALERRGHAAAGPARRVVELYLRARFGAEPLDDRERRVVSEALGVVRGLVRPA
jgi:transglutaminase-like putative cysteine protease